MDDIVGIRSYLRAAAKAEEEALEEREYFVDVLDQLDSLYRKMVTGRAYSSHPASGLLAMNSHSLFLAATGTALRGQFPPTFMILRGCVESAFYSYLIGENKLEGDVWLNRQKNPEETKAKFTANRAIQKLEQHDSNLAARARETYEWMIEFGGHPNPFSVIGHVKLEDADTDGNWPLSFTYINSADSSAVLKSLAACIENACLAVAIICHAMRDHPESESTFQKIWALRGEFDQQLHERGYLRSLDD